MDPHCWFPISRQILLKRNLNTRHMFALGVWASELILKLTLTTFNRSFITSSANHVATYFFLKLPSLAVADFFPKSHCGLGVACLLFCLVTSAKPDGERVAPPGAIAAVEFCRILAALRLAPTLPRGQTPGRGVSGRHTVPCRGRSPRLPSLSAPHTREPPTLPGPWRRSGRARGGVAPAAASPRPGGAPASPSRSSRPSEAPGPCRAAPRCHGASRSAWPGLSGGAAAGPDTEDTEPRPGRRGLPGPAGRRPAGRRRAPPPVPSGPWRRRAAGGAGKDGGERRRRRRLRGDRPAQRGRHQVRRHRDLRPQTLRPPAEGGAGRGGLGLRGRGCVRSGAGVPLEMLGRGTVRVTAWWKPSCPSLHVACKASREE